TCPRAGSYPADLAVSVVCLGTTAGTLCEIHRGVVGVRVTARYRQFLHGVVRRTRGPRPWCPRVGLRSNQSSTVRCVTEAYESGPGEFVCDRCQLSRIVVAPRIDNAIRK